MNTIAEQIANKLKNDGTRWETEEGVGMGDLVDQHSHTRDERASFVKLVFRDGSCIVVADGGWDFGFADSDCFCWEGVGHTCGGQ